ncbi:MAG TPA: Smr/MutS family protein [Thermoanaerobaculia bacterium]|nr:Smr/MutS family protein [Thermoanaerobaculia bacterium]
MVASLARTPPGRRAILGLLPAHDEDSVSRRLAETGELWEFRTRHGRLPLAGVEEIAPVLEALRASGGAAAPEDFRPVLSAARAAEAVRRALAKAESPLLSERRDAMPGFVELLGRARRLFDSDGSVRDDASPELAQVRSSLRKRRGEVSRRLGKLLEERRDFVGDAVVVLRNDRYCLPVVATARSRVPGIVHDRSGSGQTVFVEPMEVIESNNEIALLAAQERREVEDLLASFGREVLAVSEDLEAAISEIGELDALEAKVEFGESGGGRIPEISRDGGWALSQARHPLLDPRFSRLRNRALGETRKERPVVPLDLELTPDKRLLVISGPNAGGKTVVLKTAGLFSLMAQSGLPLPCGPGTRLPVFGDVRAEIGDAQEILAGRSTFSSSMETLAAVLEKAGPDMLVLIDEVGAATDPEEGSALAIAFLEEYLSRGGRAIVTTHFSALKNFAASRPDSISAAMEFDEQTGRPNYRIHPGLSGRSRALSVAREQGVPEKVLARAREILGEAWRRREEQESEAEAALERLRRAEKELEREREAARKEAVKLARERERQTAERAKMLEEGLAGFEKARVDLEKRVEREIETIRRNASRRAEASAASVVERAREAASAEPVIEDARQEVYAKTRELAVGGKARVHGSKLEGTVLSLDAESVWLDVSGKRMRFARTQLEPAAGEPPRKVAPKPAAAPRPEPVSPATREVNVIGQRVEDALPEIEKFLDSALLEGVGHLRIVHGHGTGRLREAVRDHFRAHPAVSSLRAAPEREGGNGATILELR